MKNRMTGIMSIMLGAILSAALVAGCGGGGGGVAQQTVTGSVLTPGGGTSRILDRSAGAALANVTSQVDIVISAAGASGALSQVATARTDASGNYSVTLPAGVTVEGNLLIASASVGGSSIRAFLTGTTGAAISPVTEAAVGVVEDSLPTAGNYSSVSAADAKEVQDAVAAALAAETFSGAATIAAAVSLAETTAASDIGVQESVSGAIAGTTTAAVIVSTDYTSGSLSALFLTGALSATQTAITNITTVSSDPDIRTDGAYVYVINRYGADNIQVLNPANGFSLVKQYSTGNGSNPYDIEFISSAKAYISRYGSASILIVHPTTGAELGTIDLSAFADTDGIPEMSQMVMVGAKVFVAVQNMYNWAPAGTSRLVVIDTATDTVVDTSATTAGTQAISLIGQNPQTLVYNSTLGKIIISSAGGYYAPDVQGGVDLVDPSTYAVTQLVSKADDLGGNSPSGLAVLSSTKAYLVTSDSSYTNHIVSFNPATGAVGASDVYSTTGYVPMIAIDPFGFLVIPDQSYTNPGLVFVNTATDVKAPIPVVSAGLPPSAVTFVTYSN